ncbi:hypothetical protein HF290_13060, partial [Acidithiobacillus ferrooxidans]|uniref:hypothetical protein n=1 Tax=Acidithiobacillus ferrooxidans TaxID=920 RepID=UPI001C079528
TALQGPSANSNSGHDRSTAFYPLPTQSDEEPYSIRLICSAVVDDLDNWEHTFHRKFGITAWLDAPTFRLYYGMRNHIWFAFYRVCKNKMLFLFNGLIFFIILVSLGALQGKYRVITTIYDAAHDGLSSDLGENHKYLLPGNETKNRP